MTWTHSDGLQLRSIFTHQRSRWGRKEKGGRRVVSCQKFVTMDASEGAVSVETHEASQIGQQGNVLVSVSVECQSIISMLSLKEKKKSRSKTLWVYSICTSTMDANNSKDWKDT